jgi:allophanate hydrolase subunit 1
VSEQDNKRENQGDFFSNMMFGRRPEPPKEEKKETETKQEANQIEQVIELVQALGPVLEQFAPVATAAKSYLSKKLKNWSSESKTDDHKE